jgi:hypothetical protein
MKRRSKQTIVNISDQANYLWCAGYRLQSTARVSKISGQNDEALD